MDLSQHQLNLNRANDTKGRFEEIPVFIFIYGLRIKIMSCHDELFMRSREGDVAAFFSSCDAKREINTKNYRLISS